MWKRAGDLLDLRRELQRLLEQLRQLQQRVDVRLGRLRRQRAAHLAQAQRQQVERDELRRERLGRGDADLRARRACRSCRRSRASPCCRRRCRWRCCAAPSRFASRSAASVSAVSPDCVITIASVFGGDDRVAVAVLRAVVDFDRHARQLLDQELADQRRVPRRAAREDRDAARPPRAARR